MPHNSARNQCSAKIPRMDRNDHQAPDQHRKHGDHQAGAEQSALLTDNRKDHIILRFRHKAKLLQAFSKPAAKDSPAADRIESLNGLEPLLVRLRVAPDGKAFKAVALHHQKNGNKPDAGASDSEKRQIARM